MAFVESIGLDPKGLRGLHLAVDGVWAEIVARDSAGHFIAADGDAACHRMFIPYDRGVDSRDDRAAAEQ